MSAQIAGEFICIDAEEDQRVVGNNSALSVGNVFVCRTIGVGRGNRNAPRQVFVAGILARRIVSWVTLDDNLEKGELYGLIRFGSCTELVMPKNVEILVKKGQKVVGGETIIGRIP